MLGTILILYINFVYVRSGLFQLAGTRKLIYILHIPEYNPESWSVMEKVMRDFGSVMGAFDSVMRTFGSIMRAFKASRESLVRSKHLS